MDVFRSAGGRSDAGTTQPQFETLLLKAIISVRRDIFCERVGSEVLQITKFENSSQATQHRRCSKIAEAEAVVSVNEKKY